MNTTTAVREMKLNEVDGVLRPEAGTALAPLDPREKFEFSSLPGKLKSWLAVRRHRWMPAGYEDERGFHFSE